MRLMFLVIFSFQGFLVSAEQARVMVGGQERHYLVHWPSGSIGASGLPAVIVLHGGGGNAEGMARITNWNRLADSEKFLVVYPNGSGRLENRFLTWNSGNCCGYAREHSVDDVKFLSTLIEALKQKYRINPDRVYLTGLSNGAMMAYRAGCELSEKIAAIAPVAGALNIDCHPSTPLSVVIFHGTADEHVLYEGGTGKKQIDRARVDSSVSSSVQFWVKANACASNPVTNNRGKVITEEYNTCRNQTAVKLFKLIGEGHTWPGGVKWSPWADEPSKEISATQEIWNFFKHHPRQK